MVHSCGRKIADLVHSPGKCCKLLHRPTKIGGDTEMHQGTTFRKIPIATPFLHCCSTKAIAIFSLFTSRQARMIDYVESVPPSHLGQSFSLFSPLAGSRSRPSSPRLHFTLIHTRSTRYVFLSSASVSQRIAFDSSQKSEI